MRFGILVLATIFFANVAYATIRTVSNNPNIPAQYTNLQTAINESAVGDTIYISWSNTTYGNITLNKRLVIIGDGYNQGLAGRSVTLEDLTISQVDNNNNCSESILQGLSINSLRSGIPNTGKSVDDLTILRTRFRGIIYFYDIFTSVQKLHSGWYFKDCIFENHIYFSNSPANKYLGSKDIIFSNSVFQNALLYMGNPTAFVNCMFVEFWKNGSMFNEFENALFTSCIFLSPPMTVNNSTFNNCLTFSTGDNTIPYGTNTGEDNLINEDPKFVNVPTKTVGSFSYTTHDARLQSDSPAKGSGLEELIWVFSAV